MIINAYFLKSKTIRIEITYREVIDREENEPWDQALVGGGRVDLCIKDTWLILILWYSRILIPALCILQTSI